MCEDVQGSDVKVIEIPYQDAHRFMKEECGDNLEILVSKLQLIDNKIFLIGKK